MQYEVDSYTLEYMEDENKYYISFVDSAEQDCRIQIDKEIFDTYMKSKKAYTKIKNETSRHLEHSLLTDEEIYNAAKKAELHNFIESLDDKYNTIVGERGIKLSGGQRQRIALARIFLRNSKIVIFDEATSSLDNNTEFKIQKNIHKYFNNQTIICIAHRLSTLKDMDNILVINKGKIADFGTPDYIIPKYDNKKFMIEDTCEIF